MRICVDVLPRNPEECLFSYNSHYYKNSKTQCHVKRGAVCQMLKRKECPYLCVMKIQDGEEARH